MTPTARLTHALRSLADALEGPLPCSDPEMPARRLMDIIAGGAESDDYNITDDDAGLLTLVGVLSDVMAGTDALDALCDAGLCDE